MEQIKEVPVIRYRDGLGRLSQDRVVREYEFTLSFNGAVVERGTCLAAQLEEMARGFLLTEGYVACPGDIRAVSLGEGRIEAWGEAASSPPPGRVGGARWTPEQVMDLAARFLHTSELFRATGSVHSALLAVEGQEYYAEDLGRHNAIDKVVGMAAAAGAPLARGILYTSGRLPVGMARKAVRAGIPAVVSRSAPTDLTLALARETGLTVIGFAREGRMNLYAPLEGAGGEKTCNPGQWGL